MKRRIKGSPTLTRKERNFLETIRWRPDHISLHRVEGNTLLVQTLLHEVKFCIDPDMFQFVTDGFGVSFEELLELEVAENNDK